MYPDELDMKDTTESNTSASYFLDVLLSIGKDSPFTTNMTILTSISQTFRSWVAIFHLRQSMACLCHSSYGKPSLAPLISRVGMEAHDHQNMQFF